MTFDDWWYSDESIRKHAGSEWVETVMKQFCRIAFNAGKDSARNSRGASVIGKSPPFSLDDPPL